jgi:nucleotide-binding universal stress UspA family protein
MYTRIVVPVDGSFLAETALPHAQELARAFAAPLHLVRVVDGTVSAKYDPVGLGLSDLPVGEVLLQEREDARAYLDATQERLAKSGLEVTTELRSGAVVRELLTAAREGDVYVMASHGRTGMQRWFMGSVAEEMTRQSRIPVMLVRTGGAPRETSPAATKDAEVAVC